MGIDANRQTRIKLINMLQQAMHFTFFDIAPCLRHATRLGPYLGCWISQLSRRGEDFVKQKSAPIKNTVVGITGKKAPIIPKHVKNSPNDKYSTFFIKQSRPIQSNSVVSVITQHRLRTFPTCFFYTQIVDKMDLHPFAINQTYLITIRQNKEVSIYIRLIR